MKKIKNKFIIIVITLLFILIVKFFIQNIDNNLDSKALLKSWEANITRESETHNIEPKIPFILANWDMIRTQWTGSLLIITWWDGSVTRLGWNSSMVINDLDINNDLSSINISFELIAWKTWSNITSFFWEESYFLQTFNDNEAAVRWTIFDVDLDNKYLHVSKHAVSITNNLWKTVSINENQAFNIESFSFINLIDFINNYKDKKWQEINQNLDKLQLDELTQIMSDNLKKTWQFLQLDSLSQQLNNLWEINSLTWKQKDKIYNQLLEQYQQIHFADSSTPELLGLKLDLKQTMLEFANNENEEYLIESTVYDLEEVKKTNNPYHFQKILNIFIENKDIVDRLDISLLNLFDISQYSQDFKAVIFSQLDIVWELLTQESILELSEFNIWDFKKSANESINSFLDENLWTIDFKSVSEKFKLPLSDFQN